MGKKARRKASEAKRNREKKETKANEQKEMEEMIMEKQQLLKEIDEAGEYMTRYQRDFLRYHQELADSQYGTRRGLDVEPRWCWLSRYRRTAMMRWDDGPDLHFDRSPLSMKEDKDFMIELREAEAFIQQADEEAAAAPGIRLRPMG